MPVMFDDIEEYSSCHYSRTESEMSEILSIPFNDLIFLANGIYRKNFPDNKIQLSALLSIKSGSCSEDCKYCSQSAHYKTFLQKTPSLSLEDVEKSIKKAKEIGADRFCFAAAWRSPSEKNMDYINSIIALIKKYDMESCASLGMLTETQATTLKQAGLDYYNHNIDTSREHYADIVTTHSYDDRLNTLKKVSDAGIKICSGGIFGIGESEKDRISMINELASMNPHPESVPINLLVPITGTPAGNNPQEVDPIDFVKMIALARITLPKSYIRIAAGRLSMTKEVQMLCFLAGANSIFIGENLLTTENVKPEQDKNLLQILEGKNHVGID